MKWMIGTAVGLLALTISVSAQAFDTSTIRAKMAVGDYAAASAVAESSNTADGLALAAECLLSEIMLGEAEKNKKQAKRARKLAEAALELDPSHQNARLQYAIADGFVTRETGDVSAWMKKLPQKTYDIVQAYRTDFPDDVRGDALLGAWHLAVVEKAGDKNARKWFDASIEEGVRLYEKALKVNPDDAIIGVNYAFGLIALDDEDRSDVTEAWDILDRLSKTSPTDHLNRTVLDYGRVALTQKENREAARDYVGQFLEGRKPELDEFKPIETPI